MRPLPSTDGGGAPSWWLLTLGQRRALSPMDLKYGKQVAALPPSAHPAMMALPNPIDAVVMGPLRCPPAARCSLPPRRRPRHPPPDPRTPLPHAAAWAGRDAPASPRRRLLPQSGRHSIRHRRRLPRPRTASGRALRRPRAGSRGATVRWRGRAGLACGDLRASVAALGAGMVGTGVSLGDRGAKRRSGAARKSGAGEEELFALRGRRKKGKIVFV